MKIYKHDAGNMIKMAAMPIYGKNPLKKFPLNQWNDFNEIRYVVAGTSAHQSLCKLLHWVDHDLFSTKSNFAT